MFRHAAIAIAMLIVCVGAAAHAATVKVQPRQQGATYSFTCTSAPSCGIKNKLDLDNGVLNLDPSDEFDVLEFETDKKNVSGNFIVNLGFGVRILNATNTMFNIAARGVGAFTVGNSKRFSVFSIQWDPIANIVVPGIGSFAVTFLPPDFEDDRKEVEINARLTHIPPVPLPAGAWLLLSALSVLGLSALRRRRATA